MRKLLVCGFIASVIMTGCTNGVSSSRTAIRSSLPEKTNTILDVWPEAGAILFSEGRPVNEDTYAAEHRISVNGILVIEVRSHDFDPVAVLLDREGNLVAFNDNWEQTSSARLVVKDVPGGARLLVFSPDDTRGLYDVLLEEGTPQEIEEFIGRTSLSSGEITGWIDDDRYDVNLDRILRESFGDQVYITNYPQAMMYPFLLEAEGIVSLTLTSEDFDSFLVLAEIKGDTYKFIEYCDDYSGSDSRIVSSLDPGSYMAIVMPYSAGEEGRFILSYETLDEEYLTTTPVEAGESGRIYSTEITEDNNFAIGWWSGIEDSWESPGFLNAFTPVAGFEFNIEVSSVYEVNAFGDTDVCLTLLKRNGTDLEFVASNDDYADLGSDSRVVEPLLPGEYTGLVSLYGGTGEGEVSFYWQEAEIPVTTLREGRSYTEYLSSDTENLLFRLDLQEGLSYSVSAESSDIDLMITLILSDGTRLTDDDGGDGTNSLLHFSAGSDQTGEGFLMVSKYSDGEGMVSVLLEETGQTGYDY